MSTAVVNGQASRIQLSTHPSPNVLPADIPRRPSPWHDIAHSLSTTSLPPSRTRRDSSASSAIDLPTPPDLVEATGPVSLSASQALREWEERLSHPDSDVTRHQLVPHPRRRAKTTKLAAERDKMGYIEYKLKLIEPTQERFEKLVTQMMWRLKQGKNEAIYELGLADDGTVIGLSRAEMDASLRTLELMASEVGATVIVLKEIVLSGTILTLPTLPLASPFPSSLTSFTHASNDNGLQKSLGCLEARPDIDKDGQPRKGNRSLSGRSSETDLRARKGGGRKTRKLSEDSVTEACLSHQDASVVDGKEMAKSEKDVKNVICSSVPDMDQASNPASVEEEDQTASFQLDMDDSPSPTASRTQRNNDRRYFEQPTPPHGADTPSAARKKDDKKRRKSIARQKQRRMDLLRGDGTNPMWTELTTGGLISHHPSSSAVPNQPIRPSSLRLATPVDSPADSFIDDLLHIPLDSLSLSFADVRTVSGTNNDDERSASSVCSSPAETEYAPQLSLVDHALEQDSTISPPPGEELICVEALVVRKTQHDHGEDGEGDGEEEEDWGYGGDEDVWGFGAEDE
ncbi:hypothetical protein IAR55_005159 [Kwoniella newhampshirensis]|uniref:Uncharacterized protein n=1 Tax=Kwoniella newhampshirensis TaxID=1651941 RepID=A0AAW0Z075_9TREE